MKITITKEHIQQGRKDSACWCPIAWALRDAGFSKVFVGEDEAVFTKPNDPKLHYVNLSKAAQCFIRDFDNGLKVHPRTIELDAKEQ